MDRHPEVAIRTIADQVERVDRRAHTDPRQWEEEDLQDGIAHHHADIRDHRHEASEDEAGDAEAEAAMEEETGTTTDVRPPGRGRRGGVDLGHTRIPVHRPGPRRGGEAEVAGEATDDETLHHVDAEAEEDEADAAQATVPTIATVIAAGAGAVAMVDATAARRTIVKS